MSGWQSFHRKDYIPNSNVLPNRLLSFAALRHLSSNLARGLSVPFQNALRSPFRKTQVSVSNP